MKPTSYKFWMVWRENSPTTRYRHPTKRAAIVEAERLAGQNPGEVFYVLKTTAALTANQPKTIRVKLETEKLRTDNIPF